MALTKEAKAERRAKAAGPHPRPRGRTPRDADGRPKEWDRQNGGWKVAMATTSSERGLSLRSPGRYMACAERLIQLWREKGAPARLRDRVLRCWMDAQAYRIHTFQTVTRMMDGGQIGADSSFN